MQGNVAADGVDVPPGMAPAADGRAVH